MTNVKMERFRNSMGLIRRALKLSQQDVGNYIGVSWTQVGVLEGIASKSNARAAWDEDRYNKIRELFENEMVKQSEKNKLGVKTAKQIFDAFVDNYDEYDDDYRKVIKIKVENNFKQVKFKTRGVIGTIIY